MFNYKTFYNTILKIIFTYTKIDLQSKMSVHYFEFYVVVLEDWQSCCAKYMDSYWVHSASYQMGTGVFFSLV